MKWGKSLSNSELHLMLWQSLWGRFCYYIHFTNEETASERWGSCLRSHSKWVVVSRVPELVKAKDLNSRSRVLEFSSVQFSHSVRSNSLQPQGLPYAKFPCPSPTPGACSNSCPLSWWCHPTISSTVVPISSCLQSFPAIGSFPRSQFFPSGGQCIKASASTSVLPMNIQGWFPLGGLVGSPCSPRDSQESSPTPQFKSINSSALSFLYG